MARLRQILGRRFRANTKWDLVELERLPESVRGRLSEVADELHGGAVLVPRPGNGAAARMVGAKAAQLLRGLPAGGRLPGAIRSLGGIGNCDVARLVLDEALEIEERGRFVSGPAAHSALFCRHAPVQATGRLAELSLRALRYGQALKMTDSALLARRLYGFGAIPRGPRWDLLVGGGDAIGLLGIEPQGRVRHLLAGDYQASTHPNWLSWSLQPEHEHQRPELPYKLYVSPRPEALAGCFPILAGILSENRVGSFKVARGVAGLLRPDKFVAYFEGLDHLRHVAAALSAALEPCPAQGVPFTAEASADGLLSWAIDPPSAERRPGSSLRESWRYRVTSQLAAAIVIAQSAAIGVEPWEYALDRVGLEGVDPRTWAPAGRVRRRRPEHA